MLNNNDSYKQKNYDGGKIENISDEEESNDTHMDGGQVESSDDSDSDMSLWSEGGSLNFDANY